VRAQNIFTFVVLTADSFKSIAQSQTQYALFSMLSQSVGVTAFYTGDVSNKTATTSFWLQTTTSCYDFSLHGYLDFQIIITTTTTTTTAAATTAAATTTFIALSP